MSVGVSEISDKDGAISDAAASSCEEDCFMPVFKRILVGGIAISALSVGLSIPALAQTESATAPQPVAEDEGDAIVVTGIRASQRASIDLKRENIAVVDSIVAEDMGKLPDQNVAESLQRIAGVTIERNRGEGRFVTVRGFGPKFNAVTVNGRTLATDNNGREFSFDVLPSEMITGADVYKSPQANLNHASVGATVDIRTMRPLDQPAGLRLVGSGRMQYSELSETLNPELSAVGSWRNDAGSFGVALSAVWAKQQNRDDEFTISPGHVHRSSMDSYCRAGVVAGASVGQGVGPFATVLVPLTLPPFLFDPTTKPWGPRGTHQTRS